MREKTKIKPEAWCLDLSGLFIRPLDERSISEIKKIELESRLSPWSLEDYQSEIGRTDSMSFVAVIEKETAGFLVARLIMTENMNFTSIGEMSNARNEVEIYNLAVSSKWRRRGLGRKLIGELIKKSRNSGVKAIWLEVRESNLEAIEFYRKNHFKVEFTRKNFYTMPSENALVLKLDLEAGGADGVG